MSEQQRLKTYFDTIITNDKLSHAYLLVGPLGSGKKALAQWVAKKLFCIQKEHAPCQTCQQCQRIEANECTNLFFIQPDGKHIKVDQIRQLKSESAYSSLDAEKKVFIIEEADTLNVAASNSLLKLIEEPEENTYFILLTTNKEAILPTILSRVQIVFCDPIVKTEMQTQLEQDGVSKQVSFILAQLTQNKSQANELLEEGFEQLCHVTTQWANYLLTDNKKAFLMVSKQLAEYYTKKQWTSYLLDIVIIYLSQLMKQTDGHVVQSALVQHHNMKKNVNLAVIHTVMRAKEMVQAHVSAQACLEWLVLQMKK